jgi:hypothetical protein
MESLPGPDGVDAGETGPFLLLCADFDVRLEEWARALCEPGATRLRAVLECCKGFPLGADPVAVADFLHRHHTDAGFTVQGYRRTSVAEVREALALRDDLRELAIRARTDRLSPSELRDAWQQLMNR